MADDLADDGWIVSVECPVAGSARYLAGFDTPREALLAIKRLYGGRQLRFVGCVRADHNDLTANRVLSGEVRPFQ